jgi:hypothetical protein
VPIRIEDLHSAITYDCPDCLAVQASDRAATVAPVDSISALRA